MRFCVHVCDWWGESVLRKSKLGFGLSMYEPMLGLDLSINQGYIFDVFV